MFGNIIPKKNVIDERLGLAEVNHYYVILKLFGLRICKPKTKQKIISRRKMTPLFFASIYVG